MRGLICALLLVVLQGVASGQEVKTAGELKGKQEREVLAALRTWLDALARNDFAAVERIVADDYVITAAEGKVMNKTEDLEPIKTGDVKFETANVEDVNIRVFGKTAIVTGIGSFKVVSHGRRFEARERFTDVYVKRKGRWQPVASHTTPLRPAQK
jgi:ketosteroid isomerase-like protein